MRTSERVQEDGQVVQRPGQRDGRVGTLGVDPGHRPALDNADEEVGVGHVRPIRHWPNGKTAGKTSRAPGATPSPGSLPPDPVAGAALPPNTATAHAHYWYVLCRLRSTDRPAWAMNVRRR